MSRARSLNTHTKKLKFDTHVFLASCEEFKYSGDAVSIIYPQPDVLTRRFSRANDDDNIAVDSARVTSRINPMRVSYKSGI